MFESALTLVELQIDYSHEDAPKTLRVVKHNSFDVPVFCISYTKTDRYGDDWFFRTGDRIYKDNLEGFETHTLNGKFKAIVWLPVSAEDITVAERNSPCQLIIVIIQRRCISA